MSEEIKQQQTPAASEQPPVVSEQTTAPAAPQDEGDTDAAAKRGGAHEAPKRNKYADKMNKKKKKKNKKLAWIIGILVVLLFVALAVFLVIKTRKPAQDLSGQIAVVTRGMLETYIEGDGVTAANKREELGKEFKGKIDRVLVEVGDEVSEGDELIVINPTETREELKTAEEELTTAKQAVTEAQTGVTQAQTQVTAAQNSLSKLTVAAPFTGKLIPADGESASSEFRVGQMISDGQTIGYMVDDSSMQLSLYFSSAYQSDIKTGQTATVSIPSAMSSVTGTVSSIESAQRVSDEGVKLFRVNVTMKNPGTLTKGMTATATISSPSAGEVYPADSGTLQYSREEEVSAQVGGEITKVGGIDYYSYSKGDVIMRLTSDTAQNELKTAQAAVTAARTQVTNAQKVVTEKQKRVTELTKLIRDSSIKATIDGVVVSLNAVEGMDITGGDALVVIADMEDIIVNANIASTDVMYVQTGQPATMSMYTPDGEIMMTGWVESVAMEPNQDTGGQGGLPTFPAVISIDPSGQPLSIGQYVNYKITTASSMDCLIVPSSAVVYTEEGTAVFAKLPDPDDAQNDAGGQEPSDWGGEPIDDGFADDAPMSDDPEFDGMDEDADAGAEDEFWTDDFSSDDGFALPEDDMGQNEIFDDPSSNQGGGSLDGFTFENTLPIPEGAEVPEGFVLVPVEVGISDSTNTEILWGLKEGVIVFLAGPADLYASDAMNGMSVAVG